MTGFSRGRVIIRNVCQAEAPSTAAALYISVGNEAIPAASTNATTGNCIQISTMMTDGSAWVGLPSQVWGGMPSKPIR